MNLNDIIKHQLGRINELKKEITKLKSGLENHGYKL